LPPKATRVLIHVPHTAEERRGLSYLLRGHRAIEKREPIY